MAVIAHSRTPAISAPQYAGFWIRVLAFLIDAVAIGVIVSAVTLGRAGIVIYDHWFELVAWRNFVETVVGFAYFTVLWSALGGGQTLGMRVFGLHVVGANGQPIGFIAAVTRWVGIVISAAIVLIGLLWVAIDLRKQGWHDKIAGTFVIEAGGSADGLSTGPSAAALAATRRDPTHPVARGIAVALGVLGAAFGLTGAFLSSSGDAVIPAGTALTTATVAAFVALASAVVAWIKPSVAAVIFGAIVVAYWVALGPLVEPWYDGLLAATAAGPAAENEYWYASPAMALFVASGFFVAFASLLALVGIDRGDGHEAS